MKRYKTALFAALVFALRWRAAPTEEKLRTLLLTVNAIAMGQKMTG